jgi:hypothetical protein
MVLFCAEKSDSPKTHPNLSHLQCRHNTFDRAFLLEIIPNSGLMIGMRAMVEEAALSEGAC